MRYLTKGSVEIIKPQPEVPIVEGTTTQIVQSKIEITEDIMTKFREAVYENNQEIQKSLIEQYPGIVNHKMNGETILHYAINKCWSLDALKRLLEIEGLDLRSLDADDNTALHIAIQYESLEVVELLVQKDPTLICLPNKDGKTPLDLAWERSKMLERDMVALMVHPMLKILETLIKYCPKDYLNSMRNEKQQTLLHLAIYTLDCTKNIIDCLLDKGIEIDAIDNDGNTALHLVDETVRLDIVEYLADMLSSKGKLGIQNKDGETVLHICSKTLTFGVCYAFPAIKKLCKFDDKIINIEDKNHRTALDNLLERLLENYQPDKSNRTFNGLTNLIGKGAYISVQNLISLGKLQNKVMVSQYRDFEKIFNPAHKKFYQLYEAYFGDKEKPQKEVEEKYLELLEEAFREYRYRPGSSSDNRKLLENSNNKDCLLTLLICFKRLKISGKSFIMNCILPFCVETTERFKQHYIFHNKNPETMQDYFDLLDKFLNETKSRDFSHTL